MAKGNKKLTIGNRVKPITVVWPEDLHGWIKKKGEDEGRKFGPQVIWMLRQLKAAEEVGGGTVSS